MSKRDPTPINAKWNGQKLYQCRLCAFNSTDRKRFERHFAATHPPLRIIDGGKADEPPAATTDEQSDNKPEGE